MKFQFTPAAESALAVAARWSSNGNAGKLELPELLLGLTAEPEYRAAGVLAAHGVNFAAVRSRWPELELLEPPNDNTVREFSPSVHVALYAAADRLHDYPQPLALASEHLLLGLLAVENPVSAWLIEQGLDADKLEADIHKLYGHSRVPLAYHELDPPPAEDKAPAETSPLSESDRRVEPLAEQRIRDDAIACMPAARSEPRPPRAITAAPSHLLRVLDANENRAREGLRVVEDYARFVLDDRHLTQHLKQLRHDLAQAFERIPAAQRYASRETEADVGTSLSAATETNRSSLAGLVSANFKRAEEALRSLEEFSKLLDPALGSDVKQLRYRVYTLQRAVETTQAGLSRLAGTRLYVLIDGRPSLAHFEQLARTLIGGGVHALQLRDKQLTDRELLGRAKLLRDLTRDSSMLCMMNDRPDLALLSAADGVHVGQEEVTVKEARAVLGPAALIGVSTHSHEQARQAVLDGANYLGVGPTSPSGTKRFDHFPGIELLRAVSSEIRLPAFAIGGITLDNLEQVLATGISRVAVGRAITDAPDPAAVAQEMLTRLPANTSQSV